MKLIDFQLLVTHVIGFVIVFWLLRRFAWGRILGFLDQRRERIVSEFDAIEQQRTEVAGLRQKYESHLRNIDVEARQKIQEAIGEGNAAAARIQERAQEERRQRLVRAEEEVRLIEENAKETLRRRTVDLVLLATEKAVQEQLDASRHATLVNRFLDELETTGSGKDLR